MKTYLLYLMMIHILSNSISVVSLNPTFEHTLRKHGLDDETIKIMREQKVNDIKAVTSLTESDVKDLGLPIGQKVLLRELVIKLRASSRHVRHERDDEDTTDRTVKKQDESTRNEDTGDDKEISEKRFWCIFKCLGGKPVVVFFGILGLIQLATYGLPVILFGAAGIVAASLVAKILALYGGTVEARTVVAVLQPVTAVVTIWKPILFAFFVPISVITAVATTCSHCMDQ